MKKHLFYTFLVIFIITAAITILGILKIIIIDSFYLKGLFTSLIIELIGAVIAIYKGANFFSDIDNISKVENKNGKSIQESNVVLVHKNNEIIISSKNFDTHSSKIIVSLGDITNKRYNSDKCIVLPVNSSFKDECIKRKNSSTGAYIHSYLGANAENMYENIYAELSSATNAIGQLVRITNFMDKGDNVIFLAVTLKDQDGIIRTNPISISYACQELVRFARANDIFDITCPIFGSGDGGVLPFSALAAMIKGIFESFKLFGCNKICVRIIAHNKSFVSISDVLKGLENVLPCL